MASEFLGKVLSGESFALFDGAMGTQLVRAGLGAGELPDLLCLQEPDVVIGVHRSYVEAGSQIVTTNTFGSNSRKLSGHATVEEAFEAAVRCARAAEPQCVAADIGPLGELMAPMGDLTFADAFDLFAEQARAAEAAGADAVIVETMADTVEITAAVLAVRMSCSLPVFATMTFTETGRTFLGSAPESAALVLSALGVDALGVNCSAGPDDLRPVVTEMIQVAPCPVIVQANAGLPQVVGGETVYTLPPSDYAASVALMVEAGATVIGGCCGTDPGYISALAEMLAQRRPVQRCVKATALRARAQEVAEDGGRDGDLLAMILEADDLPALKEELSEEYE